MRDLAVQNTYNVVQYYINPYGEGCTPAQNAYYVTYNYTTTTTTATQIHQNWGWGPGQGSDAGDWYAQGVFKTNAYGYGSEYDFNHQTVMVAYITPL